MRANVLRWLPMDGTERVLDLGGCPAVTELLRERAASVHSAGVPDEKYDLIVVPDRFAELACRQGEDPDACPSDTSSLLQPYTTYLRRLLDLTAPGGRILIGAENRIGLKYFAGNREPYTGAYFRGIEGYTDADRQRTFSRKEWEKLLEQAGIDAEDWSIYYPFPDHIFPMQIFSGEYLPRREELLARSLNFTRDRMAIYDDERVMQTLLDNDLFPAFSNSFLIEIRKDRAPESVIYTKFANERAPQVSMYTQVLSDAAGSRSVRKMPSGAEAKPHAVHIAAAGQQLRELYAGTQVDINQCTLHEKVPGGPEVELEYLTGETYESLVDRALQKDGPEAAEAMIRTYIDAVIPSGSLAPFQMTQELEEIFGVRKPMNEWKQTLPVTNIDAIMANMICGQSDRSDIAPDENVFCGKYEEKIGQMFDYEWTFAFPIPVQFLIWRILNYYIESSRSRKILDIYRICEQYGIREQDIPVYREMEASFQKWVRGKTVTLQESYTELNPGVHHVQHAVYRERSDYALQVYYDTGSGYSEQNTTLYPGREGVVRQIIPVPERVQSLRLDPGARSCICRIETLRPASKDTDQPSAAASGNDIRFSYHTNGHKLSGNLILFSENDPQIIITEVPADCRKIEVSLTFSPVWPELMQDLCRQETIQEGGRGGLLRGLKKLMPK